jgi:hypothetical protein
VSVNVNVKVIAIVNVIAGKNVNVRQIVIVDVVAKNK